MRAEKMERNLNFDQVIDRRNTDCLKYDFAVQRGKPADVLPLWVADMDFQTSSLVLDALQERINHGIFGYTESGERYFEALAGWMKRRHGWEIRPDWLVKTPGVVVALALAVKAYTEPGDGVLITQPVYYPFTEVIEDNGRVVISSDLVLADTGYHIDFKDFEKKIAENHVKLFLLCNPHNPVGRAWTREELLKIGSICQKYGVIVVSDEIHEDFVFAPHRHQVFANLSPELASFTVTCTSPAKTFNLAGLQVSNILISDKALRDRFVRERNAIGYSQLGTMGLAAGEAAYRYGDTWYDAMMEYVEENIRFAGEYINENLPGIRMIQPEGTYLVWLDFRALGLTETEREDLIVKKAGLWLDSGAIFGTAGEGFERINAACPRSVLKEALNRLKTVISDTGISPEE